LKAKKAKAGISIDKKTGGANTKANTTKGSSSFSKKNPKHQAKQALQLKVKDFLTSWDRMATLNRTNGILRLQKWKRWHKRELDLAL
jgi:hypothetical protein